MKDTIEERVADLWSKFKSPLGHSSIDNKNNSMYDLERFLRDTITSTRKEAFEECIELSDEIELREPDGGTKQWMAFKVFRNTMRERLLSKI